MGKKNRVPEPETNAFDRAKAAFDRVGEDYAPASKAVELPKKEEPAEVSDAAATPETLVDVPGTDDAEAVSESDAAATPDEPADSAEPVDSDANGVESADNADTSDAETDAEAFEPVESSETPETPVSEAADTPDAAPEEPVSETVEAPDADADEPAAPIEEVVDSAAPPDTNTDTAAPETDEGSGTPEPDAVEAAEGEADDAEEESDDFWTFDADEPESEEVTEMEKLTMETKEITLGVHRSLSAEADTESREQEKKSKFYTKAFDRLKDALRTHPDSTEHVEHADDSTPPSGGSSRDAAIRKRVMQIEDEETRNYLLDRVLPQMTWYSTRSKQYRTAYYRLMAITIFLGGLIPVFSVGGSYAPVKVILALLGASVTAINAYMALHNYHDLWITYQKTREDLIHVLYCYFNNAGVFAQKKMSERDLNVLLVDVCEDTLSKENGGWTTIVQKT